jgi:hypothetical protein
MTVFCDFAPCSLVEAYQRFRGACSLYQQGANWLSNCFTVLVANYVINIPKNELHK